MLFPKHCIGCRKSGEYLCSNCFSQISFVTESTCTICNKPTPNGKTHPQCFTADRLSGTFCAIKYRRIARKLIYQLKYSPYLTDLLPILGDFLEEALVQNEVFMQILQKNPVLVPIPLSNARLRKRGYNHAALLAKTLGKRFSLEVVDMVKRIKETKPQFGLTREERAKNMQGAFELKKHVEQHKTVILVDDVLTTGSTCNEAAKVLKQHGAGEVWGVALCQD